MYIPKEFEIKDLGEIIDFLQQHSLGILIVNDSEQQHSITHLPFRVEKVGDKIHLYAHLANQNPQLQSIENGKNCSIVFQGANTYISSSVYSHENVPTWNYQAVHINGHVTLMTTDELLKELDHLMGTHEEKRENPLKLSTINSELVQHNLKHITGIKIISKTIQAKYKLSQNRNKEDYQSIISDLENRKDSQAKLVAEAMKKLRS